MSIDSSLGNSQSSVEVDPNKLTVNSEGNALGFEKLGGFEEVTNFSLEVSGYVGDGRGNVIGYILSVVLAVVDPLDPGIVNSSKWVHLFYAVTMLFLLYLRTF